MKKIIALSSADYFHIVKKIYKYCKLNLDSKIYPIVSAIDYKTYASFVDSSDNFILLPNYYETQSWENDPQQVEEIKNYISEFEKSVRIPVNRLLLANERDIGRAYSKDHYYWPEKDIVRHILKNTEICNIVLMRMFKFAFDIINQYQPSICLGSPTGGMVNSVFYFICNYLNIPYIAFNISVTVPNHHFWVSNWGNFNTLIDEEYQKKLANHEKPSAASLEYIKNFREKPFVFPHLNQLWKRDSSYEFYKINKNIIIKILHRLIAIVKRIKIYKHKPIIATAINNYRTYFLKIIQRRFYKSYTPEKLAEMKYIYYPFHLDPEFVLNVQGSFWHNQYNTIKLLSYNLPLGYKLLVREHRYNTGRRPSAYLKKIRRLPGVELITAFEDQYKYIANANLVVTVSGTTGFEGLLLKRPVLTLDRTFYDALGYATKFHNNNDLGKLILNVIQNHQVCEDYDEKLALFLDAEKAISLPHDAPVEQELTLIQRACNERNQTEAKKKIHDCSG